MAEITKAGNKLIVDCDCGAVHKITKDENGELQINSTYKKPKKEIEDGNKKERKTEEKSNDGWFD